MTLLDTVKNALGGGAGSHEAERDAAAAAAGKDRSEGYDGRHSGSTQGNPMSNPQDGIASDTAGTGNTATGAGRSGEQGLGGNTYSERGGLGVGDTADPSGNRMTTGFGTGGVESDFGREGVNRSDEAYDTGRGRESDINAIGVPYAGDRAPINSGGRANEDLTGGSATHQQAASTLGDRHAGENVGSGEHHHHHHHSGADQGLTSGSSGMTGGNSGLSSGNSGYSSGMTGQSGQSGIPQGFTGRLGEGAGFDGQGEGYADDAMGGGLGHPHSFGETRTGQHHTGTTGNEPISGEGFKQHAAEYGVGQNQTQNQQY